MPAASPTLRESLAAMLADLPGVFSTPQWGGRAYKLPGPDGRRTRPKLVAFACEADGGVVVSFKLPPERATGIVDERDWIEPHSFRTLAPSGWVTARVTRKRQLPLLGTLLTESRALHPMPEKRTRRRTADGTSASEEARRIDRVMRHERPDGWEPG